VSAPASQADEQFIRRAQRLAINGRGRAEPNPIVGCVIVKEGRVIGGGYHQQFGQPHADPNALASCIESPQGATAYVTLEPCCHTNKKTPPCVPQLIEAGLARVVAGCLDPNPEVNGKGLALLRQAGVEVTAPVLEAECKQLIAPFIAYSTHKRPYVTLKWAQTADNKIAGPGGVPIQITNPSSTRAVQALRARAHAIAIGIGTLLADNPRLTVREIPRESSAQKLRIILDPSLRVTPDRRIFEEDEHSTSVRVYHRTGGLADRIRALAMEGINLRALPTNPDARLSLLHLLRNLHEESITHLLVEPGPTLAQGFFAENLADRVWVFRSSRRVHDSSAPAAPTLPDGFIQSGELNLDGDVLVEYLNTQSPLFFAPAPSPDFVLTESTLIPHPPIS
jgi:diaminohydroxyphosphoribosylaminopyrimidine deaminase/5-amino-6-(5-phosphoribosylamino)uracil reductase